MAKKRVNLSIEDLYQDRELYFRTCLKIVPKNAKSRIPLVLKKEQRRLAEAIDNARRNGRAPRIIVLKSRRIGASTLAEAELFRECHCRPDKRALVVAHVTDSAGAIFDMSKTFYDELPDGMKPPRKYDTKKLIHFGHNDSRMQVVVAGEARGYTAQYVHISELAFIADAEKLMTAILHTAPDDPDSLIIAESTPNGIGNYFHDLWVNAVAGKNEWVPFFSPWFEDETYIRKPWFEVADLNAHDAKLMATHHLTIEQMAWYVYTRENKCNGDQDKMDQENASDPLSCFLASGRKVFDTDGLNHYLEVGGAVALAGELPPQVEIESSKDDKHAPLIRVVKRGRYRIYRPPQKRHLYVVGADLASGDPGGDYTPLVVLNRHTLDVDAVFYSKAPPEVMASHCAVLSWWYNTAIVAGEANNHGILFFDELIRRIRYPNIHYRKVNEESVSGKVSDKPGIWTSGANREALFNLPRRYVRERAGRCVDPDLLKEWSELFYDDSDRVDHPKGGASDGTSAFAMCLYVHSGGLETTLQPLSLETQSKAVTMYRDNMVRRSMGIAEQGIDLGQLTMDEIQRIDDMAARRDKVRSRSGLGGHR